MPITHLSKKELHVGNESFEESYIRHEMRKYLNDPPEDIMFFWDRRKTSNNPNGYIAIQGEDFSANPDRLDVTYKNFLDNAKKVLDFSETNVREYYPRGEHFKWLPDQDSKVSETEKTIDVLFYGHMTPRRQQILEKLGNEYQTVVCYDRPPMSELKVFIEKSEWVLSISCYDNSPNDTFRVTPALNMGAKILTQENWTDSWYVDYLKNNFKDRVKFIQKAI